MYPLRLGQFASLVGGKLIRGNPYAPVRHTVYGGTRYLRESVVMIFNPRKDVKKQLIGIRQKRSAGIVVPYGWHKRIPAKHNLIIVKDTSRALLAVMRWIRARSRALFIGITGSAGKTTTKEMLSAILAQKYVTLKSYANLNLASLIHCHLLRVEPRHQAVVLEMGMASLHNIKKQCLIAKPQVGVVTNVGEAHVGSLGSSLSNVVRAKQELVDGLRPGGFLVVNADDRGSRKLNLSRYRGNKILSFGIKNKATVQASHLQYTHSGMRFLINGVPYTIPNWGLHNILYDL